MQVLDALRLTEKYLECWITVSLRVDKPIEWAESGHEVAWCQQRLMGSEWPSMPPKITYHVPIQIEESKTYFQLNGSDFSIQFDRIRGCLANWTMHGEPVFTSAPTFAAWRPPTENDIKYDAERWNEYSLNNLQQRVVSVCLRSVNTGHLEITVEAYIGAVIRDWGFVAKITYSIYGDGKVGLSYQIRPRGYHPKTLPRLGIDMKLPADFIFVDWFGCGPEESYADKRNSQKVGFHSRSPDQLFTSYEYPQENGNRAGTRWLRVKSSCTVQLEVTRVDESGKTGEEFDFTALHYTGADLVDAKHPVDLKRRDDIFLRLDAAHAGLGTARCGPGTLEKYQVKCEETSFAFVFSPSLI